MKRYLTCNRQFFAEETPSHKPDSTRNSPQALGQLPIPAGSPIKNTLMFAGIAVLMFEKMTQRICGKPADEAHLDICISAYLWLC